MDKTKPPPNAPVYMSAPGATLYRHICFNCHGPKADGKGLQGGRAGGVVGGRARPANFREGLFGPSTQPGRQPADHLRRGRDAPACDAAQLGLALHGLDGARRNPEADPQDIIHQVEATARARRARQNLEFLLPDAGSVTGNMLNLAKGLCGSVLPDPTRDSLNKTRDELPSL